MDQVRGTLWYGVGLVCKVSVFRLIPNREAKFPRCVLALGHCLHAASFTTMVRLVAWANCYPRLRMRSKLGSSSVLIAMSPPQIARCSS
jgi:hypothetical protein